MSSRTALRRRPHTAMLASLRGPKDVPAALGVPYPRRKPHTSSLTMDRNHLESEMSWAFVNLSVCNYFRNHLAGARSGRKAPATPAAHPKRNSKPDNIVGFARKREKGILLSLPCLKSLIYCSLLAVILNAVLALPSSSLNDRPIRKVRLLFAINGISFHRCRANRIFGFTTTSLVPFFSCRPPTLFIFFIHLI